MLIPTSQNTKSVTDMREDAQGLLKQVEEQGLVYLFQRSDPKAVILSIDQFKSLVEAIEDAEDSALAERVMRNPKTKFIPLEKFWKQAKLAK